MSLKNLRTLEVAVDQGVMTVTLNRPERMNAYNLEMHAELIQVLDAADADDAVRALIFTGAGKAFCAGADLAGAGDTFDASKRHSREEHRDEGGLLTLRMFEMSKPMIAAINGAAVGIGVTMTLPMDIRLIADGARVGFVFTRRGIACEACSSWFLPRLVGVSKALEWVLSGRVLGAREALDAGLVSRLVEPEELLPTAQALARDIADNTSAVAVTISRQLLWRGAGASHPMEAHRIESKAIYDLGQAADVREGVESFLAKRPAKFPSTVPRDLPDFYPWWETPGFDED